MMTIVEIFSLIYLIFEEGEYSTDNGGLAKEARSLFILKTLEQWSSGAVMEATDKVGRGNLIN